MVNAVAADAVEPEPKQEVIGHWSASQKFLRAAWQPPRDAHLPDQLRRDDGRSIDSDAILDRWPELKLGVLDGRSPREAAGDPACRTEVLAAILVLAQWTARLPGEIDYNELRARLGLPVLGPIDAKQQPIDELPVVRLGRVNRDGLSDKDLTRPIIAPARSTFAQPCGSSPRPSSAAEPRRLD